MILLLACAPTPEPEALPEIPLALRSCPERKPAPPPPPTVRTPDALILWGNETVAAWNGTAAALAVCDKRRAELWDKLQELLRLLRDMSPPQADMQTSQR